MAISGIASIYAASRTLMIFSSIAKSLRAFYLSDAFSFERIPIRRGKTETRFNNFLSARKI